MLSTFGQPLIDRNAICGTLTDESTADQSEATSSQFIIECSEPLMGRYLSIQLMQYGSLQLDEVKVLPEPGNLRVLSLHVCAVYITLLLVAVSEKLELLTLLTLQHFFLTYNMKVMCACTLFGSALLFGSFQTTPKEDPKDQRRQQLQ